MRWRLAYCAPISEAALSCSPVTTSPHRPTSPYSVRSTGSRGKLLTQLPLGGNGKLSPIEPTMKSWRTGVTWCLLYLTGIEGETVGGILLVFLSSSKLESKASFYCYHWQAIQGQRCMNEESGFEELERWQAYTPVLLIQKTQLWFQSGHHPSSRGSDDFYCPLWDNPQHTGTYPQMKIIMKIESEFETELGSIFKHRFIDSLIFKNNKMFFWILGEKGKCMKGASQ